MQNLYKLLPTKLAEALSKCGELAICELRLRVDLPVVVDSDKGRFYLGSDGHTNNRGQALVMRAEDMDSILLSACECSVYAYNEQIKNGFITLSGGFRLGLAGEFVQKDGVITTLKRMTSCTIRFPNEWRGCGGRVLPYILSEGIVKSTLIISPPGGGKTTLLRDLARQISEKTELNVLLLDERREFGSGDLGACDIIRAADKRFGLSEGLRAMSAQVLVCDELLTAQEMRYVEQAILSGVAVLASMHGRNIADIRRRTPMRSVGQIFDRYIVLESGIKRGALEGVYDSDLKLLYTMQ